MIVNEKRNETELAIDFLRSSPVQFYPTGSRSCGAATADSDYDFYCQSNHAVMYDLVANGFYEQESSSYYKDDLNVAVVYVRGSVHVQLVKDVKAKMFVEQYVNKYAYMIPKYDRKYLWKVAYDVYSGMLRKDETGG